ncbi:MAG: NUMOD3 domain-containing DNA-binding protein [Gammaproteobacteria bacterium]|nr:NUMOD3 domain-containing DNA-binding protein [Gammaproteobacteria bacterium]
MENLPYLYIIGWSKIDKWYVGCQYGKSAHPSNLWKTYFTSSHYVKEFRAFNGEPDVIEILAAGGVDQIINLEIKFQECFHCHSSNQWLNKQIGRTNFYNDERSIEKQKTTYKKNYAKNNVAKTKSEIQTSKWNDPVYREKQVLSIQAARLGKGHTDEAKAKISKAKKGSKASEKTKEILRRSAINRAKPSAESIEKIRVALTGRTRPDSVKEKLRKANLGKKLSDETKEKLRENYISFEDFLFFLKSINVNSYSKWQEYINNNPLPNNIPRNPIVAYSRRGIKTSWMEIKKKYL